MHPSIPIAASRERHICSLKLDENCSQDREHWCGTKLKKEGQGQAEIRALVCPTYYRLILDGLPRRVHQLRMGNAPTQGFDKGGEETEVVLWECIFVCSHFLFSQMRCSSTCRFLAQHPIISFLSKARPLVAFAFFVGDFKHALTHFQLQVGNTPPPSDWTVAMKALETPEATLPFKNSTCRPSVPPCL